jgi:hypothetical protein
MHKANKHGGLKLPDSFFPCLVIPTSANAAEAWMLTCVSRGPAPDFLTSSSCRYEWWPASNSSQPSQLHSSDSFPGIVLLSMQLIKWICSVPGTFLFLSVFRRQPTTSASYSMTVRKPKNTKRKSNNWTRIKHETTNVSSYFVSTQHAKFVPATLFKGNWPKAHDPPSLPPYRLIESIQHTKFTSCTASRTQLVQGERSTFVATVQIN